MLASCNIVGDGDGDDGGMILMGGEGRKIQQEVVAVVLSDPREGQEH
jgi:hypothetical protein